MSFIKKITTTVEFNNAQISINSLSDYINYTKTFIVPPKLFDAYYPNILEDYAHTIYKIITYLRTVLKKEMLTNETTFNLDINELIKSCCDKIHLPIIPPDYDSIIYLLGDSRPAHFHISEGKIEMAENLETLPELLPILTSKINSFFQGLTVPEAQALLNQMRLLPKDNDFESSIEAFKKRQILHTKVILDICLSLLKTKDPDDLLRARIFISYFNIYFDFTPYENALNQSKNGKNLALIPPVNNS